MPRSPEDNEQIRAARREELLRAAAQVFARKGFAATKISDLAQAAGLSHGLVYHYFPSKEAVYLAILDGAFASSRADVDAVGQGRAIARLEAGIATYVRRAKEQPEITLLVAQAHLSEAVPEPCRSGMREFARATFEQLCAVLREAQADGDVTDEASAEELATSIICLIRGLALVQLVDLVGMQHSLPSAETVLRMLRPSRSRTPKRAVPARSTTAARTHGTRHASRPSRR